MSFVPRTYEAAEFGSEVRPIIDLRAQWFYASFNPIFDIDLAGVDKGRPQFQPAFKLAGWVNPNVGLGLEYYVAFGTLARPVPFAQQVQRVFAVIDLLHALGAGRGFDVNFGVGYNLTGQGDRWVVKMIFGVG